jgi:hypothetical protein
LRNIGTNSSAWEFSLINRSKDVVDRENVSSREFNAVSYVLGLRYLSSLNTTYSSTTIRGGFPPRRCPTSSPLSTRATTPFSRTGIQTPPTRRVARLPAPRRFTPEKEYLYLRVSRQEPFDILYFTPAFTWIYNISDRSFTVTPELLYSPVTNLELRLRTALLVAGRRNSEFGEKQNAYRAELRVRYHF